MIREESPILIPLTTAFLFLYMLNHPVRFSPFSSVTFSSAQFIRTPVNAWELPTLTPYFGVGIFSAFPLVDISWAEEKSQAIEMLSS